MEVVQSDRQGQFGLKKFDKEITEEDQERYIRIVSTQLTEEQKERIVNPHRIYAKQEHVLAVHWHPEHIPMDLIMERINNTFPNRKDELIIPTQHNILICHNQYAGVEVDCYSKEFEQKVQLLAHFRESKLARAGILKDMLAHTFKYRASQLFEFIDAIVEPSRGNIVEQAAAQTGANEKTVEFVRACVTKLKKLIEKNEAVTPPVSLKNRIVSDYAAQFRKNFDDHLIDRSLFFLKMVKKIVKENFPLKYFYRTEEIIEEVRGIGGCMIIPHPEQFWPILLADYDTDGYEVWNPQSNRYTKFLINTASRRNRTLRGEKRPILIFMGDDTHMGEKAKYPGDQDTQKAKREIGVQPAWDDLEIQKDLILADATRRSIIEEYRERLS